MFKGLQQNFSAIFKDSNRIVYKIQGNAEVFSSYQKIIIESIRKFKEGHRYSRDVYKKLMIKNISL